MAVVIFVLVFAALVLAWDSVARLVRAARLRDWFIERRPRTVRLDRYRDYHGA